LDIRQFYWDFFINAKFSQIYYGLYLEDSYKWMRFINSFLAIASSTSIAAWVIWNDIPLLWAAIIALSQVISAIKQYFPFNDRIARLSKMNPLIDTILDDMELTWIDISENKVTDEQIRACLKECMGRVTKTIDQALAGVDIPARQFFRKTAQQMAGQYVKTRLM